MTTEVVPSPTSLSCCCANSIRIRPAGCSTSSNERIVAPSLVTVTSWILEARGLRDVRRCHLRAFYLIQLVQERISLRLLWIALLILFIRKGVRGEGWLPF